MELSVNGRGLTRFVRPQDLVWLLFFTAFALFGPHRSTAMITMLCVLGIFQVMERKVLSLRHGSIVSFGFKLAVCYVLMGWTDGIASSYFWVLLLPVISAATTMGLLGAMIESVIACGAYLSFILFIPPDKELGPEAISELILRTLMLMVVGYLTHQLAQSSREAARKYEAAAEQLAESEAAVRRSDRLAALGQLSAGLAHELRNPLGTIKASAEMLGKSLSAGSDVAREMADFISTEVDRTNSLVSRFLDFARPLKLQLEATDITQVIDSAIEEVGRHQPPFDVSIYKNYSPDLAPFPLDAEFMQRVIYNLLLNAAQASPPRSTITVKTRQIDDTAEIAVIDCGTGIDTSHLENIFNPFFSTKRSGVGLGLAIVSKIVDEHGGRMAVESEPAHGSVFRVYLPMKPRKSGPNEHTNSRR